MRAVMLDNTVRAYRKLLSRNAYELRLFTFYVDRLIAQCPNLQTKINSNEYTVLLPLLLVNSIYGIRYFKCVTDNILFTINTV